MTVPVPGAFGPSRPFSYLGPGGSGTGVNNVLDDLDFDPEAFSNDLRTLRVEIQDSQVERNKMSGIIVQRGVTALVRATK
eukprot:9484254-Pyramimonas_sp.AAC.3